MGTLTLREFREVLEAVPPVLYGRKGASNPLVSLFPPSPTLPGWIPTCLVPVGLCFFVYLFLRLWGGRGGIRGRYGYGGMGLDEAARSVKLISPVITARMKLTGRHGISDEKECPAIKAMCSNTIPQSLLHSQRHTFFHYHTYSTAF
ncbi:hypothetical protein HOY80DRAFT_293956 [Tuber brumale]|nr:hypothetical protein HOY80DRAFT_293956 [Tuber brumale]